VRFNRWTKDRTWGRLLGALHAGLDASSKIDWELFAIDGTSVRASRSAARAGGKTGTAAEPPDHALGRSRGGFGTKIHIICDGRGRPMAVTVTAGQRHESTQFEAVMDGVSVRRPGGGRAAGRGGWPGTRVTATTGSAGGCGGGGSRW
jgi:hypothetical protein